MRRSGPWLLATIACLLAAAPPARGWWPAGHTLLTRAAFHALPTDLPAFFRDGAALAGHCAQDPDVFKLRATPALRNAEEPEHFIDLERLEDRPLPPERYAFHRLCAELRRDPDAVGLLPYAVTEGTERLAVAFAEHRKWPQDPHIRTRCLVYAGLLAHYAGDLCQPLHTTVHFDGRARPDGSSPRSGIHARVDALVEKAGFRPEALARGVQPQRLEPLFPAVIRELKASHALVERVYELEPRLPPANSAGPLPPEVAAFTEERARAATRFLASLYVTAWRKSAAIDLPPWLERQAPGR